MSVTGEAVAAPVKCGVPIGDFCAGLYAAYSILAVLRQAEATGEGSHIDCSMLGSLLGFWPCKQANILAMIKRR